MKEDLERRQEIKEMVRCAQLHFHYHRSQKEVAETLHLSPSKVSRLLKRAYEEGIVEVKIHVPRLPSLEMALTEKYGLRDAIVITGGEEEMIKEDLGSAAAQYFEKIAGNGAKIGISCGFTLYNLVRHLKENRFSDLTLYPLCAESSLEGSLKMVGLFSNTLVGMMAAKYRPRVTAYALPSFPVLTEGDMEEQRQAFLSRADIRQVYDGAANADIFLLGIGCIGEETPGFSLFAESYGISAQQLRSMNVVGEINYQPFNLEGELVCHPDLKGLLQRIVAIPASHLREMAKQFGKFVIAVAGGAQKLLAIRGALAGRFCNVLITDETIATALLQDDADPRMMP
ncbi:MAG: winged helix-turn-helix transcriptional regulator [Nitrospinota bacterium]|nr:MAG: winged helix-turn-helix transcriptional regulator [Nitrospinota bacterium]